MPARIDLVRNETVQAELLEARRGTAYFARQLAGLRDAELDHATLLPGWTRRHLIAHVSYNARALSRLVEGAHSGLPAPMYSSKTQRSREIELGATQAPPALRNLFHHSAIHLSVAWRDLPDDRWDARVRTALGRDVPVSETVWMRSREVWLHALDFDHDAHPSELPVEVRRRLLRDIAGAWAAREPAPNLTLVLTDTDDRLGPANGHQVVGTSVGLLLWAAGRHKDLGDGRPGSSAPHWI